MFASDLDAASRKQLERGARLTELLKQPQYSPFPVEEQTVSIWAGTTGKLDDVAVQDVLRFEREFLDYLKRNSSALNVIRETSKLEKDTIEELEKQLEQFKKMFLTHAGEPLVKAGSESVKAASPEEIGQEQIVKQKR
jgi:F-type H+-transporting ATPase subunit alpha